MHTIIIRKKNKLLTLTVRILFVSLGLILSGCAGVSPRNFGISDSEWKGYDKDKKKEILNNYKQMEMDIKQQDLATSKTSENNANAATLEVKIFGGEAMLPPYTEIQSYEPVTFTIIENSCHNVLLNKQGYLGEQENATLRACYKGKKLKLDPSRYEPDKKDGTVTIPYSPLWDQGFAYHGINTDGYVKLKNANVSVKLIY